MLRRRIEAVNKTAAIIYALAKMGADHRPDGIASAHIKPSQFGLPCCWWEQCFASGWQTALQRERQRRSPAIGSRYLRSHGFRLQAMPMERTAVRHSQTGHSTMAEERIVQSEP